MKCDLVGRILWGPKYGLKYWLHGTLHLIDAHQLDSNGMGREGSATMLYCNMFWREKTMRQQHTRALGTHPLNLIKA